MCGIVGYVGPRRAQEVLLLGLKRLEYRGYDSAGLAVLSEGRVSIRRCQGKIKSLETLTESSPFEGNIGIGHTRWATHGRPSEKNAHPHLAGNVVVVHNGIIENYLELKSLMEKKGRVIQSETDSEIIAHLVDEGETRWKSTFEAVREAVNKIKGSYALVFLSRSDPGSLWVAKNASPIVVGLGEGEAFVASDVPAVLDYTRRVVFLEDGDIARVSRDGVDVFARGVEKIERPEKTITWDLLSAQKGGYDHFMLKEIFEQPRAISDALTARISLTDGNVFVEGLPEKLERVSIVACGTSWHAGLVGKFLIEELARIPVEVDYGSEFRYRNPLVGEESLLVLVSQSGETADTLAGLEVAKAHGSPTLSICNVVDSSLARKSDSVLFMQAGPEIGVASTKTFTTELVALFLLAICLGQKRGCLAKESATALIQELVQIPQLIEQQLTKHAEIRDIAYRVAQARDFLFLGRGINYPVALEGALKLKEISYIHAEGYPAGEMKHGPIALIDEKMPVVVLIPKDRCYEKTLSNLKEVESRGGRIIALTDCVTDELTKAAPCIVTVPSAHHLLMPFLLTIPLQLLAYHVAVTLGTDVDQPRNLAKSVTVE